MAQINFQANPADANEGFSLIPAGEYVACITSSDVKETKTGTGKYLSLEWTILEGNFKNQKVFENLNLWNQNQQAVEISKRAMNAICVAAGFPNGIQDSNELHNKPMKIKVAVKKDGNGNDSNNVQKHEAYTGSVQQSEQKIGLMPWQK